MRRHAFFFLMLLTLIMPASANDGDAPRQFFYMGHNSCGEWLEERAIGHGNQAYEGWILGFLTGANAFSDEDFLEQTDSHSVWAWVDNYCRAQPLDSLAQAVIKLRHELIGRLRHRLSLY
jgi:hypothetical protein